MSGASQRGGPMDRPVFIGGCMRSGTTLLMQLLDCSRGIAMPPYESYFMANFYGAQARALFAALPSPASCLPQMGRLAHGAFAAFCDADWVRGEIVAAESYAQAFDVVCREMAFRVGKRRWGDKTPGNEYFAKDILGLFPSSRFIYVRRDPRDVVSSKRDRSESAGGGWRARIREIWGSAWLWRSSAQAHAWNLANLDPARYREVSFERLVSDPAAELGSLSDFVGEDLGEIVAQSGGRPVFRQLGAGSHSVRRGSSNTSYGETAPAPGEIASLPVGRHLGRLSAAERVIVTLLCGDVSRRAVARHQPTSHGNFGARERRLAYARTGKAKFWFGQKGRRLTSPEGLADGGAPVKE